MKLQTDRLILAAALIAVLAPAAHAQTEQPPGGTQSPPAAGEGREQGAEDIGPPPWSFSVGVNQAFESDVQFAGTEGNGDWHRRLEARFGRSWKLHRGNVDLGGDANQILYTRASDMNRFTYGLGASTSYALTRRLSWRASETLNSSYAEDSTLLTTAGLIFPRVVARTNVASSELTYLLTPRMELRGDVSHTRVSFDGSDLSTGSSLSTKISLTRQITRNQAIGISMGNTMSSGITGDIQGLLGTWQATFGRSVTLNAAAGVRPYTLDGVSGKQFATGGSFGVSTRFGRGQTFAATYERAVEQAYGFGGTHLAHRFNANYGFAVGRRLMLDGTASYGLNTYPQIADYVMDGRTALVGVRYLLVSQLTVGASYGLWVRHETGEPSASTYRTSFSLSYGGAWR
jgi:hypothetical protein